MRLHRRGSSRRVVPHVVRQFPGIEGIKLVSKDLDRRKRPVGDGALQEKAVFIVGKQFQALDLMAFDGALPSQQSRLVIQPALVDVFPRIIAALGRAGDGERDVARPSIALISMGLCITTCSERISATCSGVGGPASRNLRRGCMSHSFLWCCLLFLADRGL